MTIYRRYILSLAPLWLTLSAAAPNRDAGYAITQSIPGSDGGWDYAAFDPALRRLFVARSDAVMALDVDSGAMTPALAPAARAHAVLPIPGTAELLVTDGTTGTARLIDKRTGAVRATLRVGEKPDAAVYDPVSRLVFVINAKAGTVSVVDPVHAVVTTTIALSPGLEYAAIDGRRHLFVNNENTNEMHVVEMATRKAGPAVALPGCTEPSGLAYSARADRLIAACTNGKAAIVDPTARKVVAMLDIGRGPDAVIIDEARHLVFIPCGESGVLEIIRLEAGGKASVIQHLRTERGARTGAVDPKTGKIYLPVARFLPPVAPGSRPAPVPGSFHIIVVTPTPATAG